jgi:transcriptional regulator with GAF, ATPase, and Fis domain
MKEVLKGIERGDLLKALKILIEELKESGVAERVVLFHENSIDSDISSSDNEKGEIHEFKDPIIKFAIEKKEPFFKIYSSKNSENPISIYIHPIFSENSFLGFLYIERKKERRKFSEGERSILRFAGELSSLYLKSKEERRILDEMMGERWVGSSNFSKRLRDEIEEISKLSRILIEGETGTGKTLLAELIHIASGRKGRFVVVSCPSIPENLFESEIFGHKKGAFTSASYDRKGLIGEADGGTLFLDEVSDIPLFLQGKVLRFLETGLYRRIGEDGERESRCGIIFATNRCLEREVEEGRFRKDLYFRISVHRISIPPLRERKEDIGDIARFFCMRKGFSIEESAIEILKSYDFPGNVRELENILESIGVKVKEINGEVVKDFLSKKALQQKEFESADKLEELIRRMEKGESFWDVVWSPFKKRYLTREDLRRIINRGFERGAKSYKELSRLFNIEEKDYHKFMALLHKYGLRD